MSKSFYHVFSHERLAMILQFEIKTKFCVFKYYIKIKKNVFLTSVLVLFEDFEAKCTQSSAAT